MAFELAPRQRATVRALGAALFSHAEGPRPEQLDALADGFERHLAPVSRVQRSMILLAVELVRWLPVLLFIAPRTFDDLSLDGRLRLLERMDRSRFTLLLMPLIAFKSVLSMHFFEDPSELRALGYAGDERKRWLKITA